MTQEGLDAARLALDQRKVHIDEERLAIEKTRERRESRFFRANLGIIITALISVGTIGVGLLQFFIAQMQETRKEKAEVQSRVDDQRLKVLEFLIKHRGDIFSQDDNVRLQYRTIMIIGLPLNSVATVFQQLSQSTRDGDKIWVPGTTSFRWLPAGNGVDCAGRDIISTNGEIPVLETCNAGFVGRIAVCWDGEKYRNGGARKWCTYKDATPDTCSGGSSPGVAYQCASLVKD
jgi:hypothetical protein